MPPPKEAQPQTVDPHTIMLMRVPPQATEEPEGANPQVMTHEERSGIACTLLPLCAFHTISLPSCDALTRCCLLEFPSDQCMA